MSKMDTIFSVSIFLILLAFLVSPVYTAFATIDKVVVSATSSASVGQEIQVQATVTTKRSGWGTCTVRDVQTVLVLPDGAAVTSGDNPILIGNMNGGTSTKVTWTVIFEKNGAHTLQVRASGNDSNGDTCFASESTTVTVGAEDEVSPPLIPYEALVAIGIFLAVVIAGSLMLWRRKRV